MHWAVCTCPLLKDICIMVVHISVANAQCCSVLWARRLRNIKCKKSFQNDSMFCIVKLFFFLLMTSLYLSDKMFWYSFFKFDSLKQITGHIECSMTTFKIPWSPVQCKDKSTKLWKPQFVSCSNIANVGKAMRNKVSIDLLCHSTVVK